MRRQRGHRCQRLLRLTLCQQADQNHEDGDQRQRHEDDDRRRHVLHRNDYQGDGCQRHRQDQGRKVSRQVRTKAVDTSGDHGRDLVAPRIQIARAHRRRRRQHAVLDLGNDASRRPVRIPGLQPGPQNSDRHSCGENNQFGCPRGNIHSSSGDHSGQHPADHERRDDDHHDVHHRQSNSQDQVAARRSGMSPQPRVDRPPATLPSGGSVAYFDSHVNSTVSSFVIRILCDCGFATTTSSP